MESQSQQQPRRYEIVMHKKDLLIELSSDDVYFISQQMNKWFRLLLKEGYPAVVPPPPPARPPQPVQLPQSPPPQQYQPVPQAAPQYAPQTYGPPPQPVQLPPSPPPQPQQYYTQPAPPPQPVFQNVIPQPELQEPPAQVAAALPQAPAAVVQAPPHPVANAPLLPQAAAPPAPTPPVAETALVTSPDPAVLEEVVILPDEDDFEKVMDTLMEDLGENKPKFVELKRDGDIGGMPEEPLLMDRPASTDAAPTNGSNGGKKAHKVSSLSDLCAITRPASAEENLLMGAYYLTCFEAVDQFSLKRVNSLMVKSGQTPVNHSVLEAALSKGFLQMIPDMTGTADVTEYALTDEGQKYVDNML